MFKSISGAITATVALGALALPVAPASAMPMFDPAPAAIVAGVGGTQTEQVRWVCGPYRCFHRPNYGYGYGYGPRFYHPRPYGFFPGYGFHRGWHHHWHHGYGY